MINSLPPSLAAGAKLEPVPFAELSGWEDDDHAAALEALRASAGPVHPDATIRNALPVPNALRDCLLRANALDASVAHTDAKRFFETEFSAYRIYPASSELQVIGEGFLTSYFEPECKASRTRSASFSAPLLARPADLMTFAQGEPAPAPLDPFLTAARSTNAGWTRFPVRAAIEDGALDGQDLELCWLDPVDLFFIHVQGSTRVRFADGSTARFAYAGRNGAPYTSIGKVIVQEGHMALEGMTLEKLMDWLKANPLDAKRIMRLNDSYIFFRRVTGLSDSDGPIGGAGIPLTPHRSLAVDRSLWPYGLPFFLEGRLPVTLEQSEPLNRLMIAQDTGSAILGAARGDYFMGSGAEAGRRAGLVRHKTRFTVLLPRSLEP